ncbi:beta-lactamase family protein [Nocardia sp. NBC_00508]|uniref:serine hydrolase n=1 Tax=Nocardia sp. NBC_00508 TaxID=2975992 RepID=UPI002E80F8FF|nr:serine hydrolase [Nocardia sp. NBC_00508]WUD70049.1 beta-lactamase family protein [Nocardia sp. NBC_00508]
MNPLETQPPQWPPGTEHLYHSVTFGHLVGEIGRRVSGGPDPRSPSAAVSETRDAGTLPVRRTGTCRRWRG